MEAGYPDSMNRLAYFYYLGDGMAKDEKEGIRLFKKAFSQGHLKAGTAIGMLYLFGAKDKDKKEGFRYTKKAAEGGEPTAMGNLANCWYYGNGTKKIAVWPGYGIRKPPTPAWILPPPSWR